MADITSGTIVFAVDGVEVRGISELAFTEVPRRPEAPRRAHPSEYRASGVIHMSREDVDRFVAAACPHGKTARRIARARFKARRRAYLAAKVPRRLCDCLPQDRTRAGGCAEWGADPDGNRYCAAMVQDGQF